MSEKLLSAVEAMLHARAVIEAQGPTASKAVFAEKIAEHVAAVEALEREAKAARDLQLQLAHYAAPIVKPKTMRRGLVNAVQMAVNKAAELDPRESVLMLVNLIDDLVSNSNPYRVAGPVDPPKPRRSAKPVPELPPEPLPDGAVRKLEIVFPYGRGNAVNHFAYEGLRRTLCGRDRYGWEAAREAQMPADASGVYVCKACSREAIARGLA